MKKESESKSNADKFATATGLLVCPFVMISVVIEHNGDHHRVIYTLIFKFIS